VNKIERELIRRALENRRQQRPGISPAQPEAHTLVEKLKRLEPEAGN
jgi:hypothetical protein